MNCKIYSHSLLIPNFHDKLIKNSEYLSEPFEIENHTFQILWSPYGCRSDDDDDTYDDRFFTIYLKPLFVCQSNVYYKQLDIIFEFSFSLIPFDIINLPYNTIKKELNIKSVFARSCYFGSNGLIRTEEILRWSNKLLRNQRELHVLLQIKRTSKDYYDKKLDILWTNWETYYDGLSYIAWIPEEVLKEISSFYSNPKVFI
jgi:hypothetical protein